MSILNSEIISMFPQIRESFDYTMDNFDAAVREIKAPPWGGASSLSSFLLPLASDFKKVNNFTDSPSARCTLNRINTCFDQRYITQRFLSFLLLSRRFPPSSAIFRSKISQCKFISLFLAKLNIEMPRNSQLRFY